MVGGGWWVLLKSYSWRARMAAGLDWAGRWVGSGWRAEEKERLSSCVCVR